ncbi:hypothetical protein [Kineococcus indalonis]|uniref:hypothetical protein n=1 Tax=Kineococcus indalonis TaxID=2696566 RepID=UPI001412DB3A|nr:hypothetical protein [Kineococcus indalonis]NAZ87226.1 hypothetical protein [Kineococcus indalonis]
MSGPGAPLAATPTPTTSSGTQQPSVDADLVTPGLGGFLALFGLALALYLLGRSMARRVQRVNHRARVEAEERAAAAARSGDDDAPGAPGQG